MCGIKKIYPDLEINWPLGGEPSYLVSDNEEHDDGERMFHAQHPMICFKVVFILFHIKDKKL